MWAILFLIQSWFQWLSIVSLRELDIQKLLWNYAIVYPDDIPYPSELGFKNYDFNVSVVSVQFRTSKFVILCCHLMPRITLHIKPRQQFDVTSIQCPGLTSIKMAGKDNHLVGLELVELLDVVLIQHTSSQTCPGLELAH